MSFVKVDSVEEAYQYALNFEDILTKRYEQRQRGRGGTFQRGRGRFNNEEGRSDNYMQDKGKIEWKSEDKGKTDRKGDNSYWGGNNSYRGRDISNPRGGFHDKCYRCGGKGHISFECRSYAENVGRNAVIQGESKQP